MMLFEDPSKKASFHFAAEEYIMRDIKPTEPVYMVWQTGDTVMLGANQIADIEIDREYARFNGIDIVRRSSGGGAIFTDMGTLLYTIIIPYHDYMDPKEVAREYFSQPVTCVLRKLGVDAKAEGRNDIQIDGKKISGIAQYMKYGYLCTHGSLLFNADIEKLSRVLTVDQEKITSKAIRSVSSRVTNISNYSKTNDISALIAGLIESSSTERSIFSERDIVKINEIKQNQYESRDWTFGHNPPFTFRNAFRFPDGRVEVCLVIRNGVIEDCRIFGDFLALRSVFEIEDVILGTLYDGDSLSAVISNLKLTDYFGEVSKREFLCLMLGDEIIQEGK